VAGVAGFERDKGTTQDGKVAVEIEVFGARAVLFKPKFLMRGLDSS
jgi:hypothetical protein